jgi:hypothetical protein
LLGAALLASALCTTLPARADTESITLDYDASAGCPDRKQFVARVRTFTSKAEIVNDDGTPRRKFGVQVARAGSAIQGELTIDDRGAKTTRHVSGKTCDEVVSALALATAIAIDPDALGGATEPELAEPKPNEAVTEPPAKPAAPPPAPTPAPSAPRKAPQPQIQSPPLFYLSAGGRAGDVMAPSVRFEAGGELGFTYFAPFELYVGAAYGPVQTNASLRMSDWLGWVGAGYPMVELEPISVLAELAFEAGQTRAIDVNVPNGDIARGLWAAVDVGVAARLRVSGPLFFQANLAARTPTSLQSYVRQNPINAANKSEEVYRVPLRPGYLFGLSAGAHFL